MMHRKIVYFACMAIAELILLVPLLIDAILPRPDRFASVPPASTVPPMMGFSDDSVFNVGDAKALEAFPGVGEVISQRIVEGRNILGDYRIPEDLLLVKGIGEKTLEKIMNALGEPLVQLFPFDE